VPEERWRAVKRTVDDALELPVEERAAFLDRACGVDTALRQEVDRLIRACEGAEQSAGFLAGAAASFAAPVVEQIALREARTSAPPSETLAEL
jgi:serine/threonine-protein kinase